MKRSRRYLYWLIGAGIALLLIGAGVTPPVAQADDSPPPEQVVRRAWQRAQEIGAYQFASQIVQTTRPAPAMANFGRSSRQDMLHLEGRVDVPARTILLGLWQDGGSVTDSRDAIEVRIEGDRAYSRRGGGAWEEIDDFSGAFAPSGDLMSYLAGAKNVQELGTETRVLPSPAAPLSPEGSEVGDEGAITFTRYSFDLDGPAFARHVRDRLEAYLREKGELPLGLNLDAPRQYLEMTGQGEVWVDARGLPVRLIVHLVYPEQRGGERVEADIKTDFSGFPQQMGGDHLARAAGVLGLPRTAGELRRAGMQLALTAGFLVLVAALLLYPRLQRRLKKLYAALIVTIVVSMVITPLLESHHVHAFFQRQAAEQVAYEQRLQEQEAGRELREDLLTSDWDPHRDPLAAANPAPASSAGSQSRSPDLSPVVQRVALADDGEDPDPDDDGLITKLEHELGTDAGNAHSDTDGLDDGVEVLRLGTDPTRADTDGDGIADNVEVEGFTLPGQSQRWYLDPKNPDSNVDGQVDTAECPELVDESSAGTLYCSDTDGDNIPDVFDYDNDNDGVPDRVDLSPNSVVDRNGKHTSSANPAFFDDGHPFALQVSGLTADRPVFVDFQLRPKNADHLAYALNVLDWPAGDADGQIQRVKNTTFATSDNPDVRSDADPRNANGDMRLIPMLEIEMPATVGGKLPLALTTPAITVEVRGAITATVHLQQHATDPNKTTAQFSLTDSGSYYVGIQGGACPASPSSSSSDYQCFVTPSQTTCTINDKLVNLADGEHKTIFNDALTRWSCTSIDNVVNGPYTDRMVDPAPLEPYGISVRETDSAGTLLAYVPLNVLPDDTGGGKAAFSARMIYWPTANALWQSAQQVRVVWLVQMLVDWCDESGFQPSDQAKEDAAQYDSELDEWCADPANRTMDQPQIVHMYDEEWYLTGLSVREDHGLDVAVAYADPAATTYSEDYLWHLAFGLGNTFVAGRDCDDEIATNNPDFDPGTQTCHNDNKRDITVFATDRTGAAISNSTIQERFHVGSTATITERWGIPVGALRVENLPRYDHQDYAAYIAMTETPRILDQFPHDVTPTLLFAREEHFRSAGLEAGTWATQTLTIDAAPAESVVVAALQWAPYRYTSGVGWESYPIDEYWDQMEVELTDLFRSLYPDDPQYADVGRMIVARSFYISLVQGIVNQVEGGLGTLWARDPAPEYSDPYLIKGLIAAGKGLKTVVKEIVMTTRSNMKSADLVLTYWENVDWEAGLRWSSVSGEEVSVGFLTSLGRAFKEFFVTPWADLVENLGKTRTAVIGTVAAIGAVAVIGITIYAASTSSGLQIATQVLLGLGTIMAIHSLVRAASAAVKAAKAAGSVSAAISKAYQAANGVKGCISKGAVIGLVVAVVATWAAFGLQVGLGHLSRVELGYAIAGAIASTIVAIIMFVIEAIPVVGPLIVAIIALIDVAVTLLCSAFLSEEQQQSETAQWLCGGITGIVTNVIKFFIFSSNVMVDMQPEEYDRLEFSNFDAGDFVYPEKGFSEDNLIMYSVSLTNTIRYIRIPSNMGAVYAATYTNSRLRSSTFEYRLQSEELDFHDELSRGTMTGDWTPVDGESPAIQQPTARDRFFITETLRSENGISLPEAGINRPAGLYISEGYAIPLQECYAGVCVVQDEKATEHYDLGQNLKFDVFPATLDGFYALGPKLGGWALAWGQDGDLTFPKLRDADGDGMPYDHNDNLWDADHDGLSDWYEAQTGSSSTNADSDGDGLTDYQEARFGTKPGRADSDGDGLLDCEEIFHQVLVADTFGGRCGAVDSWSGGWTFVYEMNDDGSVLTTRVTPDPLSADADRDNLTDFQEKAFGLHPFWPSDSTVLTLESVVKERDGSGSYVPSDGLVAPGDTLYYEATVRNELYNRYAQGLLDTDFPYEVNADAVPPEDFVLYPRDDQTISGQVDVDDLAATGAYSLTQVAGALITDWSELSGRADLWLPFEDPITMDRSGSQPPHDGTCVGTCSSAAGLYGSALRLYGTSYMRSDFDPSETNYAVSLWFAAGTAGANGALFSVDNDHAQQVYLEGGRVCARVERQAGGPGAGSQNWESEIRCTSGTYTDGKWHHVVHTFGGTVGGQKLYVDGLLAGSGSKTPPASQSGVNIGHSSRSTLSNFNGWIDDVRVFSEDLTEAEVQALYNQPVFDMKFDESTGFKDHSAFGNTGYCSTSYPYGPTVVNACPTRVDGGVSGKAVQFDGNDHIWVYEDSSLDLSGGDFAIAAWVNPTSYLKPCVKYWHDEATCLAWQPEGILGQDSGEKNGYPTLQRVDLYDLAHGKVEHAIRFGFGTGSEWLEYTSGDVLTENAWNHVLVTFYSDTLKLYVNGELKGQDAVTFYGKVPASVKSFDLGRSSDIGRVTVEGVLVTKHHDSGDDAELCMAFDGIEIFNQDVDDDHDVDDDGYLDYYLVDAAKQLREFQKHGKLVIWENDSDPRCGSAPNGNDQEIGTWHFYTTDPRTRRQSSGLVSYAAAKVSFTGDVEGEFLRVYDNNSTPFHGKIDEVQIYKRALDGYAVADLYRAGTTALHLQLDDPPGATSFQDAVGEHNAACSGDACPTAGIAGRVNGAAWFETAEQDHLRIANSGVNQLVNDFTVAAWIKPTSVSGFQRVVATACTMSGSNGFALGTNGTGLRFTTFGVKDYDLSGSWLQAGRWAHVVAAMDAQNDVSFYVNGVFRGKIDHTSPAIADTDDMLLIGATTAAGSSSPAERFDGRMDDVYVFRKALSAAEIQKLYRRAPVFHAHFEEDQGATQFVDDSGNANHASCTQPYCPQAGAAITGRLGRAAAFDGVYDKLQVPDNATLDLSTFSVGAWIKPTRTSGYYPQELIGKYTKGSGIAWDIQDINYRLYIDSNGLTPAFQFMDGCGSSSNFKVTSAAPLVLNQWNHVMGTFDGHWLVIYVNGVQQGVYAYDLGGKTPCNNSHSLRIGAYKVSEPPLGSRYDGFTGSMDEATVYARALSKREVEELFMYQGRWVEDRDSHDITVDADGPVTALQVPATYLPYNDVQLIATAQDETSSVAKVELGVMKWGYGFYTWTEAPRCEDAMFGAGAWCPTFVPSGDVSYSLRTRATDLVGNVAESTDTTVYVDDSPPNIFFDFADGARVDPSPHPERRNAWAVRLSGTVFDQLLSNSSPGSGVAAETVRVKLLDANGGLAGPEMPAQVSGASWWVDYALEEARPNGWYTVTVEAADQVTLFPDVSPAQIARHTTVAQIRVYVDADAPAANLDLAGVPPTIGDTMLLDGQATERPVTALVTWITDDGGGEEVGLEIVCGGITLYAAEPGTFTAQGATRTWEGQVHRGAACQVDLEDSAGDGGVTGTVRICGSQVASWDGSYGASRSVSFTADAAACGTDVAASGVRGVQIAFTPILPGSPFYSPAPIPDPLLHLPMDDTPATNGTLTFRDASGRNHAASCSGDRCPLTGEPGRVGNAARFDGAQDRVSIPDSPDFNFGTGPFAISMWLKNEGSPSSEIVDWSNGQGDSFSVYLGTTNGIVVYLMVDYVGGPVISNGGVLKQDGWHHLAVVRDGSGQFTTYLDGVATASGTSALNLNNINPGTPIWLSQRDPALSSFYSPFNGVIDEVYIFNRALSPDEVKTLALATGSSEPTLALPLDEPWALDGAVMPDVSGFNYDGTLHTGAGDVGNKAMLGWVGAHALAFDGVDDYVSVTPGVGLDLSEGSFTQAAWVYPGPQNDGTYPILGGGAYNMPVHDYPFLHVVNRTQLRVGFGDGSSVDQFTTGDVLLSNTWSQVAATFDGTTYRIYVNGQERASTDQFAGKQPYATQQLDVGRSTDGSGGSLCPVAADLTLKPVGSYSGRPYRVKFNGTAIFTSTGVLNPDQSYAIGQSPQFCGSAQIGLEWGFPQWYGIDWHSMGTYTIDSTTFSGSHRFTNVTVEADILWRVVPSSTGLRYFRGRLDDVRVYPRALAPLEVQALYRNSWRGTTLTSGADTELATWEASVPIGLEGAYRVDLRTWDAAGNLSAIAEGAWQGEVDTLAPRVALTRTDTVTGYHYVAVAQDYNLAEDGFASPCGAGVITSRGYFDVPWYLALSGGNRKLNALTAECEVPAWAMNGEIGAYDTPGIAHSVVISGHPAVGSGQAYAYVADGIGGLQILDISDPSLPPAFVGSYQTPGVAQAVVLVEYPLGGVVSLGSSSLVGKPMVEEALGIAPSPQPSPLWGEGVGSDVPVSVVLPSPEGRGWGRGTAPVSVARPSLEGRAQGRAAALLADRDLSVESVVAEPTSLDANQPFSVTVVIKNWGIGGVGAINTCVYADHVPSLCDYCADGWDSGISGSLGVGMTDTLTFTHPGFAGPGLHTIYAQVDHDCLQEIFTDSIPANNIYGPVAVQVDAFTVTVTSPPSNGLVIARDGVISASFSQPVSGTTVSTHTFTVRGRQTGIYEGSYTFGSVQFDAADDFMPGEEIVVNLSKSIRTTDGKGLIPYAWQFRAATVGGTGVLSDTGQRLGTSSSRAVALGDLDGDGDLDGFAGNDPEADQVWLNNGSGVFTDSGQTMGISMTQAVALGDLDGDGDLDAFVGDGGAGGAQPNTVWLNDGTGVFTDSGQTMGLSVTLAVALGDLDGDGDLDAFVGNEADVDYGCVPDPCMIGGVNQVWLNDGTGVFTDSGQAIDEGSSTQAVALGDVDGDGDLDALVGNRATQWVSGNWGGGENRIWLNDGIGNFVNGGQTLGITETYAVALGDLDGDGDLDGFIGNYGLPDMIWINDGTGVFTDTGQRLGNAWTLDVALGDLDSDGDLDVLVANSDVGSRVWLNDGTGVFTGGQSLPVGAVDAAAVAVALGDLDGDGDLDGFVGNTGEPGPNTVWLNNAHAPVASDDDFAVAEDSTDNVLDVLANDDDADGDSLTVLAVGDPISGTAITDGSFVVFTPTQNFSGTVVFTYTVGDPGGLTDSATVTVTVGGANDPPVAQDDAATTAEDTPITIAVLANDSDPDGQTVFLWNVGTPANGSAAIAGGAVDYTPTPNFCGTDTFTYTISDGALTDTAKVTVTVNAVNDLPTLNAISNRVVNEDTVTQTVTLSGITSGAANEAQTLTVTAASSNPGLIPHPTVTYVSPNATGSLDFAPLPDQNGMAQVEVTVSDGLSQTIRTFWITVNAINDPPTMSPISNQAVDEDTTAEVGVGGISYGPTNENAQRPDLALTASSANTALIPHPTVIYDNGPGQYTNALLRFTPITDRFGVTTVAVTVTDGLSETARTFQVTVNPVNDPPTLNPIADLEIAENAGTQVVNLSGIGTGAANEAQTLAVTAASSNPSLIPHPTITYVSPGSTGSLSFAPAANQFGVATVAVTVTDGLSATVRAFQVTVSLRGTLAYVAADSLGLQVVDVSDPTDPQYVGGYEWKWWHPYEWHRALDVAVSGHYAYLATGWSGLVAVDISDPVDLQYAGSRDTPGYALAVAISGTHAYVADALSGLHVVDISDPYDLQIVGSINTHGYTGDVVISGTYAYVADGGVGLRIVDVSDPHNPQLVGSLDTAMNANGVAISGTYAYLAYWYGGGLQVVDVSDPTDPQLSNRFDVSGFAYDVAVSGGYAYVAGGSAGLRVVNPLGILPQATACDTAGNCATMEVASVAAQGKSSQGRLSASAAADLGVSIFGVPPVLSSADPISITGWAYTTVSSLRALTLTVDGSPIYADAWDSGAVTETTWSVDWTPVGEGQRVLQATVVAWDGSTASDTVVVTVDAQPPLVSIASTVLTITHYYEPRTLDLSGLVSDTVGVAGVQVDGQAAVLFGDNSWTAPWPLGMGDLPDGEVFTVTAQALDLVGHAAQVTETVLVDVVPPAPVTLTLSSGGTPLARGEIVREVSPTLALDWTPSSDGSGLADYLVSWAVQTTGTMTTTLAAYDPLSHTAQYAAADGQKVSVQVAAQDIHGQQTWQSFGPVYVDSPRTPDYVLLDDPDGTYRGWMESGCTLVGVDRRVKLHAMRGAALDAEQRLYATWDGAALRLAWTGANWNVDGDLFIYLDTGPGGATKLFDPYLATAADTAISLPDGMAADALIWVQDSRTAVLLLWDGDEWVFAPALLSSQYEFDAALNDGQTDLYVPFDLIGLAAGDPLDLVALAGEEGQLRLWATAPAANPANSRLAVRTLPFVGETHAFSLTHRYHWDSLGAGVCPNGSDGSAPTQYLDTSVQAGLSTDPAGTAYSLLGDGLFWLQDLLLNSPPADVTSHLSFLGTEYPPVGNGQQISYTIHYRNQGTYTATGVYADVTALYALRLPGGGAGGDHQVVSLGDVGPGAEGTAVFYGIVDTSRSPEPWAAVRVGIYDAFHSPAGQPLEWLWAHHWVDREGPEFFGIQQPGYFIGPATDRLQGYAYDEAGVPEVQVAIQSPAGGASALVCPDGLPGDGAWACGWDVVTSNGGVPLSHGDVFTLSLQASDGFGQAGAWPEGLPFLVDTLAPTITFDITATTIFSGALVRDSRFTLAGDTLDDGGVAGVSGCVDGDCGAASLQLAAGQPAAIRDDVPETPTTIDGSACIVHTFTVTESFSIAYVSLGFTAEHARRDEVQVELESPAGTTVQVLGDDGVSGTDFRDYDVLLNDSAPVALADTGGDHDPNAPLYDRFARPYQPLRAFQGQGSADDWTLRICDTNPAENDGVYLGSRLVLTPRDTASKSGRWVYQSPDLGALDYVSRTVEIRARDVVGNVTADPPRMVVWVDNVAPVITLTGALTEDILLGEMVNVLSGTVSDGGPVANVFIHVQMPNGDSYRQGAGRDGDRWWFDLQPLYAGQYTVWVNASDQAGNVATVGPFVIRTKVFQAYLPLVARNYVVAPDLVVERIVANRDSVQVVVRNQGGAPVADDFWVDVYVNPHTPPTHVNQIWNDLADQGLVWGVTVPLQAGEALTLTVGGNYYWPQYSHVHWPLPTGTPVYAQVDSANAGTTYGAVHESHEITGGAYNNIVGPVGVDASVAGTTTEGGGGSVPDGSRDGLPPRPGR